MRRILIAAGALSLITPSICQAAPDAKKPVDPRTEAIQGASAPAPPPTPRTGQPVNPRGSMLVAPTARAAPGVDASATTFTYRGASHPALSAPAFSYPVGWGYRHWVVGQSLPLLFLASPYWFDDFAVIDVPPPPPGFRWVRYGPDLLLVSIRTGRIAQVIYGVFV